MKMPSPADIRRVVLETVQPLCTGAFEAINGLKAKLSDVGQFGAGSDFQHSSPFGLVSSPAKGVLAYLLNLQGRALAPIILSHLDGKRPTPTAVGEVILYCTDAGGATHPVKISLKPDGLLKVESTLKVQVLCENIELGPAGLEKIVNGETFLAFFNQHVHVGNLGAPTSPPQLPMVDADHLSQKVKAAK